MCRKLIHFAEVGIDTVVKYRLLRKLAALLLRYGEREGGFESGDTTIRRKMRHVMPINYRMPYRSS